MLGYRVVRHSGEQVVLELEGELAGQNWTTRLQRSLEEHYVDDGVSVIRVDLSPLRFIDSNGVVTLLALHRESRAKGKRFLVEGALGQVRDKLKVTGVLGLLEHG